MDKRPMGYVPGKGNVIFTSLLNIQPLDKKVPKSTKYQHIEGTIKSGNTVRDIEVVSNQSIAKRKGELFKRIKITTLYNLLKLDPAQESIYDLKNRHEAAEVAEESKFVRIEILKIDPKSLLPTTRRQPEYVLPRSL